MFSGLIIVIIASLAWSEAKEFSFQGGIFVNWVLYTLGIFGILIAIKGVYYSTRVKLWKSQTNLWQVLQLVVALILYLTLIPWLGFFVASILLFTGLTVSLTPKDERNWGCWLKACGVGIIVTLIFYGVFKYALLVPLPAGRLF